MGFLDVGEALDWKEVIQYLRKIKLDGTQQFINLFNTVKATVFDLKWGDEVEFLLVKLDSEGKVVKLLFKQSILDELLKDNEKSTDVECDWRPEFGCFMIESVPKKPYLEGGSLTLCERNMEMRRLLIEQKLQPGEYVFSMTHFPLMGTEKFSFPDFPVGGEVANSKFTPDEAMNSHTRFSTLVRNIRTRKGKNVAINVPLFMDTHTKEIDYSGLFPGQDLAAIPALPGHVYADSMAFGMGMCCLQVTFQLPSIRHAMDLYDRFIPLAPLFLSLTAATPILRGYLVNTDVRWHVIEASVDDRTNEEMKTLAKSRYASVSSYIGIAEPLAKRYNDVPLEQDPECLDLLLTAGIPLLVARHVAHLFIRDPLVVYSKKIDIDNTLYSDHFENLQSTNWQSCRFKPPPVGQDDIGWRVEFRTMELNFTAFENAAHAIVLRLLMLWLHRENPHGLIIPISKVDENMSTALKIDSVIKEKFWFSSKIFDKEQTDADVKLFTLNEIFNGCEGFPGLLHYARESLNSLNLPLDDVEKATKYINFLSQRASGALRTNANWIREFVAKHPDYKHDSIISSAIAFDLMTAINDISHGKSDVSSTLFGSFNL